MRMTSVERSAELNLSVETLEIQTQHSGNTRHAVVRNRDDNLVSVVAFSLPDPRRTHAITKSSSQSVEAVRIALVITSQIVRLSPQRPVVRAQIKRMQHPVLEHVDARLNNRQIDFVLPVVTILHDRREPRRPVRELLDLNRL